MRAMNATEINAVFGGASGIEAPVFEGFEVDPSLYPQCPAPTLPGDPETWPGDPTL